MELNPIEQNPTSSSSDLIDSQNVTNSSSFDCKSEAFLKSEIFDDDIVEIKSAEDVKESASFIIQPEKPKVVKKIKNIQNRQAAAEKLVVDRPKTAKEKTKINIKKELKPHQLGKLPKYLQNRPESALRKTITSVSTLPVSKTLSNIPAKPEKQGDMIESSTDLKTDEYEKAVPVAKSQDGIILKLRTQIADLKINNETLEKQLGEAQTARETIENELKSCQDKITNLEKKIVRNYKDQKRLDDKNVEFQVEIANHIHKNKELSMQLNHKTEKNQDLKSQVDKLSNELKAHNKSFETLTTEKNHIQTLLEHNKSEKGEEAKAAINQHMNSLKTANEALEKSLKQHILENSILKEDKHELIDELIILKSQLEKQSMTVEQPTAADELENLQIKIREMSKAEKEMNQKILTLTSKLDDEKNLNIRNNTMLELRSDYIKSLQDLDNTNKSRLVLHAKEIDDLRKELKAFKKFKASHAEEKTNFERMLKNLENENTKLKTKLEVYGSSIHHRNFS